MRQNVLVAQRFDAGRGQLSGDPVTLAQAVGVDPDTLAGSFSVSPAGIDRLADAAGERRRQLIWFNRAGQNAGAFGAPDESNLFNPELSPDGKRAAITRGPVGSGDIWMQEGTRTSRFTFDPADDRYHDLVARRRARGVRLQPQRSLRSLPETGQWLGQRGTSAAIGGHQAAQFLVARRAIHPVSGARRTTAT